MTTNNPTSVVPNSYDEYAKQQISKLVSQGKTVGKDLWVGTDKYGTTHWSTSSPDALKTYIDTYNAGNGSYTTKDGTDFTLVQTGKDAKGNPTYGTVNTTLYNIQNAYDQNANNTRAEYSANDALYKSNLELANKQAQANYDASAKQYYTQYMQNQRKLKEQASRMGLTGGASEMASLGVVNNYASNYAANEGGRNAALNQNQMDYNNRVAANHENMANALAAIYAQRASDESGFYNSAQKQAWDVANMKTQSDLNMEEYRDKLQADSDQQRKDAQAKQKRDAATMKDMRAYIKKHPNASVFMYIDPTTGDLGWTTSKSKAYLLNGKQIGSNMSLPEITQLLMTEAGYDYSNYYGAKYSNNGTSASRPKYVKTPSKKKGSSKDKNKPKGKSGNTKKTPKNNKPKDDKNIKFTMDM